MPIPGQYTTLRVRWPRTTNGIEIAYDEDRNVIWEETELPLTARPHLEKANLELPYSLRKVITVMNYTDAPTPASVVKGVGVDMLKGKEPVKEDSAEVAFLKAQLALMEERFAKLEGKPAVEDDDLDDMDEESGEVKRGRGRPPGSVKKLETV